MTLALEFRRAKPNFLLQIPLIREADFREVVKDEKKEIEYEQNEANTVLTFEDANREFLFTNKYL